MHDNVTKANVIIQQLQNLLTEMLWKNQEDFYFVRKLTKYNVIISIFQYILEKHFHNSLNHPMFSMETVAHKLRLIGKHYASFLKLFADHDYSYEDYEYYLNNDCKVIAEKTETLDSIEEAHILFSHVFLIACLNVKQKFDTKFQNKKNNLVQKINPVFEKYNNPRKILTSKFFDTQVKSIPENLPPTWVNLDDIATTDVTLDSFFQNKTIVHFIDMGNNSTRRNLSGCVVSLHENK
jgi:hypothetical protein